MKKLFAAIALAAFALVGCTRIPTGEVGLRVDINKQVQATELVPGSWNQTVIGDVLTFPVREIGVNVLNLPASTADNSILADYDVTVRYSLNPTAVSDLWANKSRSFHEQDKEGNWILMHNYMRNVVSNAAVKAVRNYKALEAQDKRGDIELKIRENIATVLKEEQFDKDVVINGVQVTSIVPNPEIVRSANEAIKAQNDLNRKQTEVEIARKEAERVQALSQNQNAIAYMNAKSLADIADGVKQGKVNTIVVPMDFKGMVNVK